ncbi:MAG: indolepyruvate oxidoreductase subunit beta [Anaerohalosphaeraceae bacterium]|nr:indolepyruvate oxidoreductase subunit beta [Anaerohalosphaeraceae bacterium]
MIKEKTISVVLAGVGGQGILLASEIVAKCAMLAGFDVKTNEVHGMAQRGGSVLAQIRYGKKVYSPLVAKGQAEVLVALEQIEALRFANYLRANGMAVVNKQMIVPVTVSSGEAKYPDDIETKLGEEFENMTYIDAAKIASELGNIRAANVVLLGAMSKQLDLPEECWKKAMSDSIKPQYLEINLNAFNKGREF